MYDEVESISHIKALIQVILSHWRYITHYSQDMLSSYLNREWFVVMLFRLISITNNKKYHPFLYHGKIDAIQISTLVIKENKEHPYLETIAISNDNHVLIRQSNYDDLKEEFIPFQEEIILINNEDRVNIYKQFSKHFSQPYKTIRERKASKWIVNLTNEQGETFEFYGDLDQCKQIDLSDLIREAVDQDQLLVMDNLMKPECIERLEVSMIYNDKKEFIVLDRTLEQIQYKLYNNDQLRLEKTYYLSKVSQTLDELYDNVFYYERKSLSIPFYRFEVNIILNNNKIINSYELTSNGFLCFDMNELLDQLTHIMNSIEIECFHLLELIKKPWKYGQSDYILCQVQFPGSEKLYYYQSYEPYIKEGDIVIVPVGNSYHTKEAVVKYVEYYSDVEEIPYDIEEIKIIESIK